MGVSRSPAELAAKFAGFQQQFPDSAREGVYKGALLITRSVRRELARAAPSGRLSGVGSRGARVSVGFNAPRSKTNPTALVRMRGPAHLLENSTQPHVIVPKRRRRAQNPRAAVMTPAGPRASVQHPGTRGKQPWAKGVRAAERQVLPTIQREVHGAIRRAFR